MKKVISFALLSAFISGSLPVSAANEPSLDFLKASFRASRYESVTQTGTLSGRLNKPVNILSKLDEGADNALFDIVDVKALIEGLFDSSISYEAKQKTEDNGNAISCELHMKSGTPVIINQNLSLDVNTGYSMWAELDLTDKENGSLDYIMSTPMSRKYLTMNSEDLNNMTDMSLSEGNAAENPMDAVWKMLDEDNMDEMSDRLIESIYQNATISGDSSAVTITFTDTGLKKYIADVFETVFSFYDEALLEELNFEESLAPLKQAMKKVPVFGNKALVISCELDSQGRIAREDFEINVDLNLFDLLTALDADTDGLTKADSDLCFTLLGTTEITYESVQISRPELTEENSVSVAELGGIGSEATAEYEEGYDKYPYIFTDENFNGSNGEKYVPVREMLETFGYDVSYDSGIITAAANSKYSEYDAIVMTIGEKTVKIGSNTLTLEKAPFIIGERSYLLLDDVEKLMNASAESYNYSPHNKSGSIFFCRNADEENFDEIK